ncbi:hypothetical protein, conserved [Leishmania tarentolae]|uniref:LysM domain-containing protein n=1 Tax=Leishmania tarentolae TaxID=5689 RepID=A0A640KI44_LEITA|nr:hypothetical protein, conserved [Leishmania tarentolae]
MEGLKRQVELLYAALQPLDMGHSFHGHGRPTTLPDEVVSELQMALARATALAHWATAVQQERFLQQLPSGGTEAPSLQCGAAYQTQTLRGVAELFKVSVADVRQWNPQLPSTLDEEDALPSDTYLKVRPSASSVSLPQLAPTSALHTRLAVSPTELPGGIVDGYTSSKTQGPDAGHDHSVEARRRNSAASNTPSSCSNITAGGVRPSIAGVGSSLFPRGSEGGMSHGRYSAWTVDSGRGSSRSPQAPELSVPNSCANAAPPSCAPEPVMMSVSSNSCSPPDRHYLIDLKGVVMEPSPSPEGDARAHDKAPCSHRASSDSPPSPPVPSLTSPPPFPRMCTLPAATAAVDAVPWHDNSSQHEFLGGGGSVTTAQQLCVRDHSRSPFCSPANEALTVSVLTTKECHCDTGAMASPGAGNKTSQSRPHVSLTDNEKNGGDPRKCAAGSATAASAVQSREAKGGARTLALPSPAREISVSLSAVSPPSSLGADGRSNSAHSRMRAGGEEGEGGLCCAELPQHQWSSPLPHCQRTPALSPSLAAPSDISSCSPMAKERCSMPAATASRVAVPSGDNHTSSGFRTPVQHRDLRASPRTTGEAFSSTASSDIDGSSLSDSHSSPGGDSEIETEATESLRSDMEEYYMEDEEEEERTPSMRPPAMLGRHVSSPPPNLSRPQQSACGGTHLFTAPPRLFPASRHRAVDSPKQPWEGAAEMDAGTTAPLSRLPSPPSSAAPFLLERPHQQLQEWSGLDDPLEEPQPASEEDYDTLEGIASAYNLRVSTIIEWNPYLQRYQPNEPLPPDLPIVLPMSSEDEEEGKETSIPVHEADSALLQKRQHKLGDRTPAGGSPSGALDNSPIPLRPL